MIIRIYATLSKENLAGVAEANGLSKKAADYFRYFTEIAIDLDVDRDTGEVVNAQIPWKSKVPLRKEEDYNDRESRGI